MVALPELCVRTYANRAKVRFKSSHGGTVRPDQPPGWHRCLRGCRRRACSHSALSTGSRANPPVSRLREVPSSSTGAVISSHSAHSCSCCLLCALRPYETWIGSGHFLLNPLLLSDWPAYFYSSLALYAM